MILTESSKTRLELATGTAVFWILLVAVAACGPKRGCMQAAAVVVLGNVACGAAVSCPISGQTATWKLRVMAHAAPYEQTDAYQKFEPTP